MNPVIEINSDMGEMQNLLVDGTYAAIMPYVTSVNIACGGHAGDDKMMQKMVVLAANENVNIGAHPSYPDEENFGRIEMDLKPEDISEIVAEQVSRLSNIAKNNGCFLNHVKPHGALYNKAVFEKETAAAIGSGVKEVDNKLILVGLAQSNMLTVWEEMGFATFGEGFADRTYESDGTLRSREFDNALITDPEQAAVQAVQMANEEKITTVDNSTINLAVQTICIHSDTPNAVEIAKAVHIALYS